MGEMQRDDDASNACGEMHGNQDDDTHKLID